MLATLGVLLLGQIGGYPDPRRSYAAGDKDAILMLPPEPVCGSDVREMVWTADGGSLVVRRTSTAATPADLASAVLGKPLSPADAMRIRPQLELLVWSARSRKARVVLSSDAQNLTIFNVQPIAGTDRVVFGADERVVGPDGGVKNVSSYSMLATGTGTITRLISFEVTQSYVGLGLSPTRPIGFLSVVDAATKARSVRFFGPDGRPGASIALPAKGEVDFDESGIPTVLLGWEKKDKKITFHYQRVDFAAGKLGVPYDRANAPDPSPPTPKMKAIPVSGKADGARAPSLLLKLEGGKSTETGIITTDGGDAKLSPKGDAVAYVSQGSAIVRPLVPVSRQAYDAAMVAAQKAIAINNAKQVALGLIMFAADMDDVLPSQSDYQEVDPYLKDPTLRDSFSYTFAGGDVTKIEKPAETEIGYVAGPGGRAVAYADGHVKWIPDNP